MGEAAEGESRHAQSAITKSAFGRSHLHTLHGAAHRATGSCGADPDHLELDWDSAGMLEIERGLDCVALGQGMGEVW
jgi:hypothetical protein